MKIAEVPADETKRIAALNELGIIYSPAEERFDCITRLARRIFDVPMAMVSLITEKTQWFKSCQGLDVGETPREISFCSHALLGEDAFIVPDTLRDRDFADNPLVTGPPHIRFYAGQPIHFGPIKLGTLCIIDTRPRRMRWSDFDTLKGLARWVETELKLTLYTESQKELLDKVSTLQRSAMIDPVTGCWNEAGVHEMLTKELARGRRQYRSLAVMVIDFQSLYSTYRDISVQGRNLLLKEMAQRIRSCVRPDDSVGRLNTPRFIIVLPNCGKDMAEVLVQRILRSIAIERLRADNRTIPVDIAAGITCNEDREVWDAGPLLKSANDAADTAKSRGTNQFHFAAPGA